MAAALSLHSSCAIVTLLSALSLTGTVIGCPPWSTEITRMGQCVCSDPIEGAIKCDQRRLMTFIRVGHCAWQDSTTNDTVVADCPYVFPYHLIVDERIPLPNDICRAPAGALQISNGTGPSIYSAGSQCWSCSAANRAYYLLMRYLPTTVLFVVIITVFRINIPSAAMAHYVLFCCGLVIVFRSMAGIYVNLLHTPQCKYISIIIKFLLNSSAMWTLDFFYFVSPPLCVSEHMEEIYIPFQEAVATFYPFILLLLTYIGTVLCSRGLRFRRTWGLNTPPIQAFATLYFVSYGKFILLMNEAFFISAVINQNGKVVSRVSYIDPNVPVFSHKHWYLIFLSLFILVFVILPPVIFLIIYPTHIFRKASHCLKPRWIAVMQTFVDAFYGCYKDGTNGTQHYRAVSGYTLAIWALLPTLIILTKALASQTMLAIASIVMFNILLVVFVLIKPCRDRAANTFVAALPAIFVSLSFLMVLSGNSIHGATTAGIILCLILSLPHCVFYGYLVYKLVKLLIQFCCTCETREMEDILLPL